MRAIWCGKAPSPHPHPNPNLVWQGAQPDGGEAQPGQLPPRAKGEQRAQRARQLPPLLAPHREARGDVRLAIELEAAWLGLGIGLGLGLGLGLG